jgi:hypothetical protein
MKSLSVIAAVLLVGASFAQAQLGGAILLSAASGTVEIQEGPDQPWKAASVGTEIREGTSLRTGPDGRAQVTFPDNAVVWVRESSNFGMQSTLPLARKVQINQGELKASIPHLKRKQTFEVHTPNAVAAVRGTIFTVATTPEGGVDIKVAYGGLTMHLLTEAKTLTIPQGASYTREAGGAGKIKLMNKEQEKGVLQNWSPGLSSSQRNAALDQKDADRANIHNYAQQTEQQQQQISSLVNEVKNSDFSAGRTLFDRHGNLTRVNQFLIRPGNDSVEFVNLVKRSAYSSTPNTPTPEGGAAVPFVYNGPTSVTNRLDSLTAFVKFQTKTGADVSLPQNLAEWPSYFSSNEVRPNTVNSVMANQTDQTNIFVVGNFGQWCGNIHSGGGPCADVTSEGTANSFGQDTVASDLYIGKVTGLTDFGNITTSGDPSSITSSMRKMYRDYSAENYTLNGNGLNGNGTATGLLFSQTAQAYCSSVNASGACTGGPYMWLASESYVIDNSGHTKNVSDFTNSGDDPFTILKNSAGEIIVYAKAPTSGAAGTAGANTIAATNNALGTSPNISSTDFLAGCTNIDLVIIPDLAISIFQNMATSLSHIKSSGSSQ